MRESRCKERLTGTPRSTLLLNDRLDRLFFAEVDLSGMIARFRDPSSSVWLGFISATALAHVGALAFCSKQIQASNVIQVIAALLLVAICLKRAQTADAYFRATWYQLSIAFSIYLAAQSYFAYGILWKAEALKSPSFSDRLWMIFAYPILLVLTTRRSGSRWEWVDWLDAAQACLFCTLVYTLVFSQGATLSIPFAYDLQSVALILAWAVRYASTQPGPDRAFLRHLGLFLMIYGVLSSLGNRWHELGLPAAGWVGLCWSAPLLFFSALALHPDSRFSGSERPGFKPKMHLPKHFHGLSALGLSVMSISAAGSLALHRLLPGLAALTLAFLIFVVRTSLREHQLHIAHSSLEHAVMHDPLTGLANRTRLMSVLHLRLAAPAEASRIALLFIDLDRFKLINDSLGHEFGDRFLVEVASALRAAVQPGDEVVRLGGDEFVVLLPSTTLNDATKAANAVVQRFRDPISLEGRVLHVSVSVGFAMGATGMGSEDLLRNADCAMYAAKKQGKNQARCFSDNVVESAEQYLRLENELRSALTSGQLVAYYQPIYSISKQAWIGFEALSRWCHPERGLVSPAEFIPIAEETGLILELGKQVLRESCRQVKLWNDLYGRDLSVSVNVSARQFSDPELFSEVETILEETGIPPSLLKLEITETVLLSGTDQVAITLTAARDLGIQVSLDDFLTGYSSLHYLLQYPCDLVKIDRSFVHTMDQDRRRAELVRTAVQLAKSLNMKVIAEGVETEEELHALKLMGCDLIQGFLFSKPLPAHEINDLLKAQQSKAASADSSQPRLPIPWAHADSAPTLPALFAYEGSLE